MAPEIITARGTKCAYSFSADIFSLGMVLYEMLSLKVPYEGDAPFVVSEKIINGERPTMPEFVSENQSLEPLVRPMYFCTSMIPECRPSPDQVLEMLEKMITDAGHSDDASSLNVDDIVGILTDAECGLVPHVHV